RGRVDAGRGGGRPGARGGPAGGAGGRPSALPGGVPGAPPLPPWRRATPHPGARLGLARRLGETLARLHAAGFSHGDLYARHVLVTTEAAGPGCCLIDWQRGRRLGRGRRAEARRLRDLAALHATLPADLAGSRLRLACLAPYR